MDFNIKKQQPLNVPGTVNSKSPQKMQTQSGKYSNNTLGVRNFQKYEVIVQNDNLQNELKLIEWRSKTELPIVKILFYKILQKKLLNQCSVLQLAIQNFPCNLNSLPKMPFYQLLYLLKESLIGFQRLFDRFGPFDITNKMILIGKNSKCTVWFNQNITLNFPSRRNKLTENQFLDRFAKIFEEKCLKSSLSTQLFGTLRKYSNIVQAIHQVQNFIKTHLIVLPNKLNSLTESLGSKKLLEKYEENIEKVSEQLFGHDTLRKVPKFLVQLGKEKRLQRQRADKSADQTKKENRSTDSPNKKVKELLSNRDHSQRGVKSPSGMSPINHKDVSIQKSQISPKSQISADIKQQSRSYNSKKQRSNNKNSKLNYLLSPRMKINFITSQKTLKVEEIKDYADELFYTTIPNKPSPVPKPRKYSFKMFEKIIPKRQFNVSRFTSKEKCPDVQCSQQTTDTLEEHDPKKKGFQLPTPRINLFTPNQNGTPKQQESQQSKQQMFERNGWVKRMNSLAPQNIEQIIESKHYGDQLFSQDFSMSKQKLAFLGSMGKELKGSIVYNQ